MDLRTQTSLIASVLSLAMAASVILRPRRRRAHLLFGLFGLNLALWYLTTFFVRALGPLPWERVNLVCAVLLPLSALQLFQASLAETDARMRRLNRGAVAGAVLLLALVFTPAHRHLAVATGIFVFVAFFVFAALSVVYRRSAAVRSRFEAGRLRFFALVGALGAIFTIGDYLPYVGLEIPPVGTVLVLLFLYALSQSLLRYRLIDLYELAGRLAVLTALSFALAGILWLLVTIAGGRFFLHAVVASLVLLILFDPLRAKVEEKISSFFFRERYDLEQTVAELRQRLAHVLEVDELTGLLLDGLERSRRVTHASIYLVDEEGHGYDLAGSIGPDPIPRLETVPARPLLDRLAREGKLVVEAVERELEERRTRGQDREAETLYEILQSFDALRAAVCLPIQSDQGGLYGLLCVKDDRLRDAFSPEEISLLLGLAGQAAIAVDNSRLYRRLKDRDRLAALGEMAAGLAHEIRNPLGAIKASAQYLSEEESSPDGKEFLGIIVEEVDRLNRVVSSFLDYARPAHGDPAPIDVNAAVRRTLQLLGPECTTAGVHLRLRLEEPLPAVRIDVEQLRQVLINLVRNAVQAMSQGGELTIATATRDNLETSAVAPRFVEIRVRDTGPGIPTAVLQKLFVPFVTTKDRGTGLGLAISQRIVSAAGGTIDARSQPGVGTTFVVRLPSAETTHSVAASDSEAERTPESFEGTGSGGETESTATTNR